MSDGGAAGTRVPVAGAHSEIWVGDLARALAGFGVDPGDRERVPRIAALLGLRGLASEPKPAQQQHEAPTPDSTGDRGAMPGPLHSRPGSWQPVQPRTPGRTSRPCRPPTNPYT